MNKLTVLVAFAAGLAGGMLSRFAMPEPVQAQSQVPKEIRAQNFVVEDITGKVVGIFSSSPVAPPNGSPAFIQLLDREGRVVWRAGGNPIRQLAEK